MGYGTASTARTWLESPGGERQVCNDYQECCSNSLRLEYEMPACFAFWSAMLWARFTELLLCTNHRAGKSSFSGLWVSWSACLPAWLSSLSTRQFSVRTELRSQAPDHIGLHADLSANYLCDVGQVSLSLQYAHLWNANSNSPASWSCYEIWVNPCVTV